MRRLDDLDSTRGLAAFLVFLSHFYFLSSLPQFLTSHGSVVRLLHGFLRRFLDGAAAVDYFFLLSGFVLCLPFVDRPLDIRRFVVRRVIRIMPTYWAALAIALGIRSACQSFPEPLQPLTMDWWKPLSTAELIDHVVLIGRPFDVRLVNGPLWSLSVEMQVSLMLPLLILAMRSNRIAIFLITMFLAIKTGLIFLPLFALGALFAFYYAEVTAWTRSLGRLALGAGLVVAALLFWNRGWQTFSSFPDPYQEWMSGLGSAFFMAAVVAHRFPAVLLQNSGARFLGRISYSFYLIHLPLLMGVFVALRGSASDFAVALLAALAAFAGAIVLHFSVEAPSIRLGRRVSLPHAPADASLSAKS